MVHCIQLIECEKGHTRFNLGYDSNECGCHHNGKPTLTLTCVQCMEDNIKNIGKSDMKSLKIEIPLDDEGNKIIKDLIGGKER